MLKPDLNIAVDDLSSVELPECRLVIEVNRQHFYYVVLNDKHSVVALKYYHFTTRTLSETIQYYNTIVNEDLLLKNKCKECTIICNFPESCMVPENAFNENLNKEIIELVYGDVEQGIIRNDKISEWESYNVYRLPSGINDFLHQQYPAARFSHFYTAWLAGMAKEENVPDPRVCVVFYPDKMIAAVFDSHALCFIQTFGYKTVEDVTFHLLNIYRQFNLSQTSTSLRISGMTEPDRQLYSALKEYFLLIDTDALPEGLPLLLPSAPFPVHYYSSLVKLALCVS